MKAQQRFLSILVVVGVAVTFKIAQQLYDFYAYEEERLSIVRLQGEVENEGIGVIATQLRADSLRLQIDSIDGQLGWLRARLDELEQRLGQSGLSGGHRGYLDEVSFYNELVSQRNGLFRNWQGIVDANHAHVDRYNLLADSIRGLAGTIGEPYFPIPTPAEIAANQESAARLP